jgi:endonuclease I
MFSRTVCLLFVLAAFASAGIPEGYYDPAEGLSGESLQWALHGIIDNHDPVSYDYVWTAFFTTDDKYGNETVVWDMYSDELYYLGDDQGGSASGEGEGYNREHSWPKSWFGDSSPMNTDLFHIVPTDIYVNNRRGNYPYAEVGTATWVSQNGSRLGYSITPGYSGMAFEPIDVYKGDFARNYFYMATRYKGEDSGWPGSPMTDGADLEDWAVVMLLQWHLNDPVSDKELERNEAVYAIQNNRNPFIDHPEYAQMIYDPSSGIEGNDSGESINMSCFPNPSSTSVTITVSTSLPGAGVLSIHDISGRVVNHLTGCLSANTEQSTFVWSVTDADGSRVSPGVYFAVLRSGTIPVSVPILLLE